MPPLVVTADALDAAARSLAAGSGPVAVDAERASGFRYGHRAFLVQFRRRGAGTVLIDPVACPDLSAIDTALADAEAVLHAASQDLPCLAEIGYRPRRLFDTELAGRLLGYPRVGLGTLVEEVLGLALEKSHSAADWSTRPLPSDWLLYAALDVEVLVELRDSLAEQLEASGKAGWARQEFAAVLAAGPPPPRTDPWRRTSGIHRVRNRRGLAVVRELWLERDRIARQRDISPTRILQDVAIIEAARALPKDFKELAGIAGFNGRGARRYATEWLRAVGRARAEIEPAGWRRAAARPPLAGARPGRGHAADRRPGRRRGAGGRAWPADGEPAGAGRRAQARLAAARSGEPGGSGRRPGPLRCPSVAGRGYRDADLRRAAEGDRERGLTPRYDVMRHALRRSADRSQGTEEPARSTPVHGSNSAVCG
jgi:ribonuclease D